MHPVIKLLGSPIPFLDDLFLQLNDTTIDVTDLEMDHICYRVDDAKEYERIHSRLLEIGTLLSNKIISGRPISVIEIHEPYIYNGRNIKVIELPSPKPGSPYSVGFEHVEFVVNEDLEDFIQAYPSINFDLKGMDKTINRDIRISLEGCAVKFHEHSLKYVIEVLED